MIKDIKRFTGKKKLLWLFSCDEILEMIKYLLSLPGIEDPVMTDGTTAFSMALGKGHCDLIKELLKFKRTGDIELAKYALLEPRINENVEVKQVLEEAILEEAIGTTADEGPQTVLSQE